MMGLPTAQITLPDWICERAEIDGVYETDAERMRLVIDLSRENVLRNTGGPFGAAVFESETGRLVAVGVNRVVPLSNSILHGEIVALTMAHTRLESFTLSADGMPAHELVSSCEPCAMCLGATLWSGVRRLVTGAGRDDAIRIGFEEGPVFPDSYTYLRDRGIDIVSGVEREAASAVLEMYRKRKGTIYNG